MNWKQISQTGAMLSALAISGVCLADQPNPVFWTWKTPAGYAACNNHIKEMIRFPVVTGSGTHLTGADLAEAVCDEIDAREMTSTDDVCILLQKYGMGDADPTATSKHTHAVALFAQWCDSLPADAIQNSLPTTSCISGSSNLDGQPFWMTPWTTYGINEAYNWMFDFLEEYKYRQDNWDDPNQN